jgi:hypothetical protein
MVKLEKPILYTTTNTKYRIEHCPNGCHEISSAIPKWHYRIYHNGWYPYWGSYDECLQYVRMSIAGLALI